MKINANISALQAARNVNRTNSRVAKSLEKLSSGYKINKVSDDPTGMAVSGKVKAQLYGLRIASKNSADGVSLVQTAEGAMGEVHEMLKRIRELTVQAGNDTCVTADREKIQAEVDQLIDAVDSIVDVTEFNKMKLIDGRLSNLTTITETGLDELSHDISIKYMSPGFPLGEFQLTGGGSTWIFGSGPPAYEVSAENNRLTVANGKGEKMIIDIETNSPAASYDIKIEDKGQLKIQTGPNENQRISLMIPGLSPESLGLRIKSLGNGQLVNLVDVSHAKSSEKSLSVIDEAVARVSTMRSTLGAYQNRLEHLVKNIDVNATNTAEALSRIQDTDMAMEMTSYTLNNVIMQSGIAMMSQANERPQQLLQLLR